MTKVVVHTTQLLQQFSAYNYRQWYNSQESTTVNSSNNNYQHQVNATC